MRIKLSTRLIIWVGLPATLLFGGVVWTASQRSFERVLEQTEQYTRGLAQLHADRLDGKLSRAAKIPESLAIALESELFDSEEKLQNYLRDTIQQSPEIYGSCLAFEPESFTPGKHYYAPYYYRKDGRAEFVQLGNPQYDYFRWQWYARPKKENRALWSDPYFDEGGGNVLMTTYSVPFHRGGAFWGIATLDISLPQLVAEAEQLSVGQRGYAFIVSRNGQFLAYPEKSKIMQATIQDANPELARKMLALESGIMRTREPAGGRDAWVAYAPVQAGEFSLAIVYPQSEVLAEAMELQKELLLLGGAGLLALFGAIIIVARSIARPITRLAQAAQEVSNGELDQRLDIRTRTEEVRHLTNAFRKMTRDLRMQMQELRYTTSMQQRLEGELAAARSIQMSMMTRSFPAFPDRREIDLHAVVKPARAVGGDFYDFYFLDPDHLCLLIGDVAGKGVPAALFMAVSKTLLKANADRATSPAELFRKVNEELCVDSSNGMFVSLVLAVLNVRTGEVEICNAGHPAPLRVAIGTNISSLDGKSGVALGAWPGIAYQVSHHKLTPGDTLVFFTDGITEAVSPEEQFYSAGRLQRVLAPLAGMSAEHVTRAVVQDVRAFGAEHEQSDDLTLLAIRWLGPEFAPSTS
ncbi:SpoIIE family protein phosphatase [Verrucomicrobiota bacterium sgz303538]